MADFIYNLQLRNTLQRRLARQGNIYISPERIYQGTDRSIFETFLAWFKQIHVRTADEQSKMYPSIRTSFSQTIHEKLSRHADLFALCDECCSRYLFQF